MKAGKTFSGDITIKDVCRDCNNGPLSKLDDYFCRLYDRYFCRVPRPNKPISFRYDYSFLMRFLLKISYNSSRSTGYDIDLLAAYASLLISEYPASPIGAVAFVGTAKAGWIKNPSTSKRIKLDPEGMRCGPALIGLGKHDWCATRVVMINGFMFTLVLMKEQTIPEDAFTELSRQIYGVLLSPNGVIKIPSPTLTTADFYKGIEHWPRGHR